MNIHKCMHQMPLVKRRRIHAVLGWCLCDIQLEITIPTLFYDPGISGYLTINPGIPGLSRNLVRKSFKELYKNFILI
jgi:hypothetical protein